MKTLGVLGGMSWESTAVYYRLLNQGVAQRLGGLHSARLLMHSVDFAPVAALQSTGDWAGAATLLGDAARGLQRAGPRACYWPPTRCTRMHRVIYEELCRGVVLPSSRDAVVALIARQRKQGAQAVILGCTEIGLLIDATCSPLPVFDTTVLHAAAAVTWMLETE